MEPSVGIHENGQRKRTFVHFFPLAAHIHPAMPDAAESDQSEEPVFTSADRIRQLNEIDKVRKRLL